MQKRPRYRTGLRKRRTVLWLLLALVSTGCQADEQCTTDPPAVRLEISLAGGVDGSRIAVLELQLILGTSQLRSIPLEGQLADGQTSLELRLAGLVNGDYSGKLIVRARSTGGTVLASGEAAISGGEDRCVIVAMVLSGPGSTDGGGDGTGDGPGKPDRGKPKPDHGKPKPDRGKLDGTPPADAGPDSKPAQCNNNGKKDPWEPCDGKDLGGQTCKSKGFWTGTLKCKPSCEGFDLSGCSNCGNKKKDAGEQCDGADLGGQSCGSKGFKGGTLACKGDCKGFIFTGCHNCGNGKKDSGENCDQPDLGGQSCTSKGFAAGVLTCKGDCLTFDTSGCHNCGNSKKDAGEQCDGSDLGGNSCDALNHAGGVLRCTACKLDIGGCGELSRFGGTGHEGGTDIAADAAGNRYMAGGFNGSFKFGTVSVSTTKLDTGFVARLGKATGSWDWVVPVGNGSTSYWDAYYWLAVDKAGNSYVTGNFRGTGTFGTMTKSSAGSADMFLAKIDTAGKLGWLITAGNSGGETGWNVAVDASNNVYVVAGFKGTLSFDGKQVSEPNSGSFLAKVSPSGQAQWAISASKATMRWVEVSPAGEVYVGGDAGGSPEFGPHKPASHGKIDVFVAKISSAGVWQWARVLGGPNNEYSFGLAVNTSGDSYLVGDYYTSTKMGPGFTSNGNADIFVIKHDSSGNYNWAVSMGGPGQDRPTGVGVLPGGDLALVGWHYKTVTFGTMPVVSKGGTDIFVARLTAAKGAVTHLESAGGTGNDKPNAVFVSSSGRVHVTGAFVNTATFGARTETSAGGGDGFVWSLGL